MLDRLTRWCHRHRWRVVLAWLGVLILAVVANRTAGIGLSDDIDFGDVEASKAHKLLETEFANAGAPEVRAVFGAGHIDDARPDISSVLDRLATVEGVTEVERELKVAPDGHVAFATVRFEPGETEREGQPPEEPLDAVREIVADAARPGLQVGISGHGTGDMEFESGTTELVGLAVALLVLLLTFGTPLAAALPVVMALFAVGITTLLLSLLARWVLVPEPTPAVATMIGLGVGIDYSLFILTRYRQGRTDGLAGEEAAARAVRTSGRAVLFAGATVVVSMLGLMIVGFEFIRGIAIGSAMAVVWTMATSITLLPAALAIAGDRVERFRLLRHRPDAGGRWRRWSQLVQRRPLISAALGTGVLLVLAIPTLSLHTGIADAGSTRPGTPSRTGYDLMADGFGAGTNGPLLVVVDDATSERVTAATDAIGRVDGILHVEPPRTNDAGDVAVVTVVSESAPQDEATASLVDDLRAALPVATYVGGGPAFDADLSEHIAGQLPVFIAAVLAASFLLLTAVFRSLVLPLKAVLMNLLSIGAAYGAVVAVFQWGWLADVFGIERTGPVEAFVPMFLFAILFGLSMDYEVFILSRIHEEYVRTGDNSGSVAEGLAATAGVITAAAAIMVSIFASFLFADVQILKVFGLGLTVAVLVDSTIVRLVVVPSSMELMGRANWWLPGWLDRLIPHIHLEDETETVSPASGDPGGRQSTGRS